MFLFNSESIFGYKDLRVELFCSAGYMKSYLNVKYTEKIDPEKFDGVQVQLCIQLCILVI